MVPFWSPRATVTRIRGLEVTTLRPFGRFYFRRATVTQIRGLEVATLRPFGRFYCRRATVTQIRALHVVYICKLRIDRLSGSYW